MPIAIGAGIGLPYGGKVPVVYLLRDEFATDEGAPLASPRTCEPGPGAVAITDTGGLLSISGGVLSPAGMDDAWDPQVVSAASFARARGRALLGTINRSGDRQVFGWTNQTTVAANGHIICGFGDVGGFRAGGTAAAIGQALFWPDTGVAYPTALVLRSPGGYGLTKIDGEWVLHWVDHGQTTTPLYGTFTTRAADFTATLDGLRVVDLAAPWDDDYGLATARLSGAQSADQTFAHEADCLLEFVLTTLPSSGNVFVWFRIQDGGNYWRLTIPSNGQLRLDEVVGGSGTNRASTGSGALAGGERIVVVAEDETIRGYYDGALAWTYAGAGNFKTETAGELESLGTGGAVSDIVSWPRVLRGAARAALEAV